MGECLRRTCPCLEALWQRIFSDKKASHDGGDGGADPTPVPRPVQALQPPQPQQQQDRPAGSGAIYTALWSFESRHPDELSFLEGDLFSVITTEGGWWSARKIDKNGRVLGNGIVPGNYLVKAESLEMEPWFFGTMNRFEAQSYLMGPENDEGAFLIRCSEKDNVGYVLSVRSGSRVKHFKILQAHEGHYYVEQSNDFSSLIDLVEYYCENGLNNTGRLGSPCKRRRPKTDPNFTEDDWELPKEEFTLLEELGSGYFSDVYRGLWKRNINVAIKIIKSDSELNHHEFHREVQILKSLRHRHLISLFAVCTASMPYYIITELMEKGSLLNFLREEIVDSEDNDEEVEERLGAEGQLQDVVSLIDMGAQVADGMSFLEERNSIHRDLAARNVLVGEHNICKVADFGLARVIKEPFYITEDKKIPYKWSAPEAISHGKFSNKSDVWSFGILLYEIITYGGVPYPALSNQEVYQQVTRGYRMPAPSKCPDSLYNIMLECWSAEPADRPDFKSLKAKLESSFYELE